MSNRNPDQAHDNSLNSGRSAIVLGGGFAGIEAAIRLRRAGYAVRLVSERKHMLVYPTSIWVVTGEHRIEQDLIDLEDLAHQHGFEFVLGAVTALDAKARRVTVDGSELELADVLVLAMGAGRKTIPGLEHTKTIWGAPSDPERVGQHLQVLIDQGGGRIAIGFGGNPADPSAIRGGPAFEVMFNIIHKLKQLRLRDRFDLTFFAPMPNPGARLGERAASAVQAQLRAEGVDLRFGKKILKFDAQGVELEAGDRIDADLVIYVPGGAGHPLLANSGLPLNEAGFVRIDATCQVEGLNNVYAIGDVAEIKGPDWRAKQGHLAEVMARVAVDSIVARANHQPVRESYLEHMGILCLMDSGNGGVFISRNSQHARVIPLSIFGHWAKKAWGYYYRFTKLRLGAWLHWSFRELLSRHTHALPAHR